MAQRQNNGLHETVAKVSNAFRIIWQRRMAAVLAAAALCAFGWPAALMLPDKYEARARVYVDTKSMLRPLLRGLAVDNDIAQEFALVTRRTLLSRPNLERVLREADLDLRFKDRHEVEMAIRDLSLKINVIGDAQESIYTIIYSHSDPQAAYRVVRSLLNIFIESSLGASRSDTDLTRNFLEKQIDEYEAKLLEAEERLKEFKQKNIGWMPTEAGGYYQRLEQTKTNYRNAQLALREAERRRDALRTQLEAASGYNASLPGTQAAASPLDGRIQALEERLDELRLQYTEHHPNVVAVKASLDELRAQRMRERGKGNKAVFTGRLQGQTYPDLQLDLGRAEADVAALHVRVEQFRGEVAELSKAIDTIPAVEAELARLNRDYEINKTNYDALVARRESAKISREAEQNTDEVQFKIIEPPTVPLVPLGPNRIVLLTGVLFAAIGGGAAFAWAMVQIHPTFDSVATLRLSSEFPVLGGVSRLQSTRYLAQRRFGLFAFVFGVAMLIGAYALLVAWHVVGIAPVDGVQRVG